MQFNAEGELIRVGCLFTNGGGGGGVCLFQFNRQNIVLQKLLRVANIECVQPNMCSPVNVGGGSALAAPNMCSPVNVEEGQCPSSLLTSSFLNKVKGNKYRSDDVINIHF